VGLWGGGHEKTIHARIPQTPRIKPLTLQRHAIGQQFADEILGKAAAVLPRACSFSSDSEYANGNFGKTAFNEDALLSQSLAVAAKGLKEVKAGITITP
jgi:hypothetical protein